MIGHLPGACNLCGRCTVPSLVPSDTFEHSHHCWHYSSPPLFVNLQKEHVMITELKPLGMCLQLLGRSHPSEKGWARREGYRLCWKLLLCSQNFALQATTKGDNKAQNNMLLGFTASVDKHPPVISCLQYVTCKATKGFFLSLQLSPFITAQAFFLTCILQQHQIDSHTSQWLHLYLRLNLEDLRQFWCGVSSLPSPQSFAPLHSFLWPIQRPFPHRNWSGAHWGVPAIEEGESKHTTAYSWNNSHGEEKDTEHFLRFVTNFTYDHKSMTTTFLKFSSFCSLYCSTHLYADLEACEFSSRLSLMLLYWKIPPISFSRNDWKVLV